MDKKTILIIGYGIDPNRYEAVSKNTTKHIALLKEMGHNVVVYNVGYANPHFDTGSSFLSSLIKRKKILANLELFIKKHNVTHILDVFVLPLSSQLFVIPLIRRHPDCTFIKIIHNDAGFSLKLHPETLIRMITNTKLSLNAVLRAYDRVFTRNLFLSKKMNIRYIPTTIKLHPKPTKTFTKGKVSVCYLGHPLKKKGIFEFLTLFEILPEQLKQKLSFTFAFSDVGPREKVVQIFSESAKENGIGIAFENEVQPHQFYRNHNVYILPIHDHFGAVSTPNTILEAMEAGCLVLTNKILSLEGMFEDQEVIYLDNHTVPSILRQLEKALSQPKQQTERLKKARLYIQKNHSKKAITKKVTNLYE